MLIPILMVGSSALILRSFPVAAYQRLITTFLGGALYAILSYVYNATFGMLSIYMVICLSYCAVQLRRGQAGTIVGTVSSGVAAFLISVGFLSEAFDSASLGAVGMFTAILCGTIAPAMYLFLSRVIPEMRIFTDGSEPTFNRAVRSILPLAAVSVFFALVNYAVDVLFAVDNFYRLFSMAANLLFEQVGSGILGGFLYILLSSVMWFFGIHGSDVLETVVQSRFEPAMQINTALASAGQAPTEICTKTFFDVFVLMGGCGCALSLLLALLLFSKRKSSRSVAKLAVFPMLFNINELMIFGLPVAYNVQLLIPFILTPLVAFLLSAAAMTLGWVPRTVQAVEWTTPILLGGYQATGSIAGSVLQLVNVVVGTLIYMPFVKRYDRKKEHDAIRNMVGLTERLKQCERTNRSTCLTEEKGITGDIAKQLVIDLEAAMDKDELYLMYQPQCDNQNNLIGAEALLRWQHPVFGMVYPPLIIKLAEEGGLLTGIEMKVFRMALRDMQASGFDRRVSVNVTAGTLQSRDFLSELVRLFPNAMAGNAHVCVEVTEQSELVTNAAMIELLMSLRAHGFSLAIDDFSMGFTSLKYLQEGRFDEVKLDGSLVRSMIDSSRTREIISSIVYLSSSLKFSVLAEFVETREQQKQLEALGCRCYQGYLFSKPLILKELEQYAHRSQQSDAI